MGGTVSLSVAVQYPQRVRKVVVVGSPVVGSSLNILLKMFGMKIPAYIVYKNMWTFKLFYRLLSPMYTRDPRWPQMMDRDISSTTLESFLFSIASLHKTDLRGKLNQIKVPTMGMYGNKDIVVHPDQWKPLLEGIPHARIERFTDAGHFIMLDVPDRFRQTLKDFLDFDPYTTPTANS